eukprot:UN30110
MAHHRLIPPKWQYLLEVIVLLLRQCYLLEVPESQANHSPLAFKPYNKLFKFDKNSFRLDKKMKDVYRRTIENNYDDANLTNTRKIVALMTWENETFSSDVVKCILTGVDQAGPDQVGNYMKLMHVIVGLQDGLCDDRLTRLHNEQQGVLYLVELFKKSHATFSYYCIEALIEMMAAYPHYSKEMEEIREQWCWMDEWLKKFTHRFSREYNNKRIQTWEKYKQVLANMKCDMQVSESEEGSDDNNGLYDYNDMNSGNRNTGNQSDGSHASDAAQASDQEVENNIKTNNNNPVSGSNNAGDPVPTEKYTLNL